MKLSARLAAAAALVLAAVTATGCAPATSDNSATTDESSGTLRVWLFQEVNNGPKEKVVDGVVAAFEKQHKGVDVDVDYIPVASRAEKMKAAFNDPKSAPDLVEYGNTDTAGYVRDGGLADVSAEFAKWDGSKGIDVTAKKSVTVDGKVYGAPLFVGVRALYYRTDVFKDLGLKAPETQAELIATAHEIRKKRPDLYGLAVGGAATYAATPFIWAQGGELAAEKADGSYTSTIDSAKAQKGIKAYTSLFGSDNCPASKCAEMRGTDTITAFASGKAAMVIGADLNRQAVEDGAVKGKYAVVPLPGVHKGEIAPAFAGGNNIGVLKSSAHRTLAVDLMEDLASERTQQKLFDAMGFLPTNTEVWDEITRRDPFVKPFVKTLDAGTKFVPATPAWATIDSSLVLPTMFQEVVRGDKSVGRAAQDAAKKMDDAFADAK
ncbi:extracellular solute-binding protein [Streptomyces sp. NPDC005318]|uniref:extracellular solute-binding protein n=1 Tax=Streptomyces sp. NPDC005318 TaxID=3157031 RepID=UPI0033BB218A